MKMKVDKKAFSQAKFQNDYPFLLEGDREYI